MPFFRDVLKQLSFLFIFYLHRPPFTPSSASLERLFSSMGHVHSQIWNRQNPERVRKVALCMRLLNSASFSA